MPGTRLLTGRLWLVLLTVLCSLPQAPSPSASSQRAPPGCPIPGPTPDSPGICRPTMPRPLRWPC